MGLIFFANTDRARDSTIFAISTFGLGLYNIGAIFYKWYKIQGMVLGL
ncbi:hypothetical protein MNB_SUP05-SYMBIONT-5-1125 [hydrothermal vent metagenome]|uniref:Uncharacterized protein n=1 Tax=hydrothermal vent metagenome TaxID=652676 RepID=A0A1W1E5V2_9ZZZZ